MERFGLAAEFIAPMRARGRVLGQVVMLRRGRPRPFTPAELRLIQAIADVIALGLDGQREPVAAPGDSDPSGPAPDKLSRREREILALLALGHTNREIAERVHLSVRTVEWHPRASNPSSHVTGRAALARIARQHGLVGGTAVDRWDRFMAEAPRSMEIGSHLQRMSCYCALIAERLGVERRPDPDRQPAARRGHGRGRTRSPASPAR